MQPSSARGDVVLRLLDGRGEQRELVLDGGRARTPFAIGRRGGWRIDASHVAEAHVMVAFNGRTLYVCTPRSEMALLDGVALDAQWREAPMPSELRFGSARVSIGRRAGPEEDTAIPEPEAASLADTFLPKRAPVLLRSSREEEATCFDEERLFAALALSRQDEDVTCITEPEAPTAVEKPMSLGSAPAPPFRVPALCTVPMDTSSPVSSMPPTIPSDELFGAAPFRPSSPTMAIQVPLDGSVSTGDSRAHATSGHPAFDSLDGIQNGGLAVSGETSLNMPIALSVPRSVPCGRLGELAQGWRQFSLAKRAIVVLMVPALLVALVVLVGTRRPSRVVAEVDEATPTAERQAPAADTTGTTTTPTVQVPAVIALPKASASAAPMISSSPNARPRTDAVGARDPGAAERLALDTVASGLDAAALEQYEVLAREHPENVAFREAVRILRQRIAIASASAPGTRYE